jgi:uracil-DNA glycosylase family 4
MNPCMQATLSPLELLQFYADIGVDEVVGDTAVDRTKILEMKVVLPMPQAAPVSTPEAAPPPPVPGAIEFLSDAKTLAAGAKTLDELKTALDSFQGLSLKRTATQIVFADGNSAARIMIVGEAPGADEDRIGRPFVGVSGQLLDRMFAAVGLSREANLYISNVINWRPPGNRSPSDAEIALSLPFIQRHIELVSPALLIFSGGVAAKALLQTAQGITRMRGRWVEYTSEGLKQPIPALAMFHPAYLLRSPAQKGLAWADLLALKKKMKSMNLGGNTN